MSTTWSSRRTVVNAALNSLILDADGVFGSFLLPLDFESVEID